MKNLFKKGRIPKLNRAIFFSLFGIAPVQGMRNAMINGIDNTITLMSELCVLPSIAVNIRGTSITSYD